MIPGTLLLGGLQRGRMGAACRELNCPRSGWRLTARNAPCAYATGAIAYEWEEVDKERFVKLYLAGLKQAAGLSKAGLAVFETVYKQVRERPGQDTVPLDSYSSSLHPVTYRRGLRELLEKEFLFRSPNPGLFFVNIRFMFNGDRLAFVKGYKLKKDQPTLPGLELVSSSPLLPTNTSD